MAKISSFFMAGKVTKRSIPHSDRKPHTHQNSGIYKKFPSCSDEVGQIVRAENINTEPEETEVNSDDSGN